MQTEKKKGSHGCAIAFGVVSLIIFLISTVVFVALLIDIANDDEQSVPEPVVEVAQETPQKEEVQEVEKAVQEAEPESEPEEEIIVEEKELEPIGVVEEEKEPEEEVSEEEIQEGAYLLQIQFFIFPALVSANESYNLSANKAAGLDFVAALIYAYDAQKKYHELSDEFAEIEPPSKFIATHKKLGDMISLLNDATDLLVVGIENIDIDSLTKSNELYSEAVELINEVTADYEKMQDAEK